MLKPASTIKLILGIDSLPNNHEITIRMPMR
jgi:hypothetical protein